MTPDKQTIINDVKRALAEDIGSGDITATLLPSDLFVKASIYTREPMLVCGQAWVNATFNKVDKGISVAWQVEEGEWVSHPQIICEIEGFAQHILTAERTALNFLQTLSGTATTTYHYLQLLKGYNTRLLDTRKTIPGLRVAQKYAVACAGGENHRMGLHDAFLIKENHIQACGSITKAILKAREQNSSRHPEELATRDLQQKHLISNQEIPRGARDDMIEVEVETLEQLKEAFACMPDRILLDNFTEPMIKEAILLNKPKICDLEVSGGINIDNIQAIARLGVDCISVGALTKSVKAIDLSLRIMD